MIEFITPGMLTTVQDRGRRGYQHFGVAMAGAMDVYALATSNVLVGNRIDTEVLECTFAGPKLLFHKANIFALSGAEYSAKLDGMPIENNRAYLAEEGSVLDMGHAKTGVRAYIAFAGGLEADNVMGSKSTFMKGGIGGIDGRAARKGDKLAFTAPVTDLPNMPFRNVVQDHGRYYKGRHVARVLLGPQDDQFSDEGIKTLFNSEYTVTSEHDRMGYRLDGAEIAMKEGFNGNIISDGIPLGAIQIANGVPIIMMADRQTTGGYAKIGSVINVDLPIVAQLNTGDKIRFIKTDIEEAQRLMLARLKELDQLAKHLNQSHIVSRQLMSIKIEGKCFEVSVEEHA